MKLREELIAEQIFPKKFTVQSIFITEGVVLINNSTNSKFMKTNNLYLFQGKKNNSNSYTIKMVSAQNTRHNIFPPEKYI